MRCPYPDCTGLITEGQNFCTTCGRPLDPASVTAVLGSAQPTTPIQPYQTPTYANPPYQYPPPQPYAQGNWPPQPGYPQGAMPMPAQPVATRSSSKAPLVILLVVLLVVGGVVGGYFALGGKPTAPAGGASSNTSSLPLQPQTFNLLLPVFDRDNYFVSDSIQGSNGVNRRLSMAALPYSVVEHGQTSEMTSTEIALQDGDKPDFSNDSTIMSINFVTAQGLADSLKSEMNSKYPGADYQIVVPTKGQSYQITDNLGWKLKITVDDVMLDSTATMSDGTASPYPAFTSLNLTAQVTPK